MDLSCFLLSARSCTQHLDLLSKLPPRLFCWTLFRSHTQGRPGNASRLTHRAIAVLPLHQQQRSIISGKTVVFCPKLPYHRSEENIPHQNLVALWGCIGGGCQDQTSALCRYPSSVGTGRIFSATACIVPPKAELSKSFLHSPPLRGLRSCNKKMSSLSNLWRIKRSPKCFLRVPVHYG